MYVSLNISLPTFFFNRTKDKKTLNENKNTKKKDYTKGGSRCIKHGDPFRLKWWFKSFRIVKTST